jgi:hypothetical protein
MKTRVPFYLFLIALLAFMAGCDAFPGLRAVTGGNTTANQNRAVSELNLVMADKTGATDPSLIAIADRIESASTIGDVIEIRENLDVGSYDVSVVLWVEPPTTQQEAIQQYDQMRRIQEYAWIALLPQSEDVANFRVTFLAPARVNTIDNGASFVGQVVFRSSIERANAADYLTHERNLEVFFNMIAAGRISVEYPQSAIYYDGVPNHPLLQVS